MLIEAQQSVEIIARPGDTEDRNRCHMLQDIAGSRRRQRSAQDFGRLGTRLSCRKHHLRTFRFREILISKGGVAVRVLIAGATGAIGRPPVFGVHSSGKCDGPPKTIVPIWIRARARPMASKKAAPTTGISVLHLLSPAIRVQPARRCRAVRFATW